MNSFFYINICSFVKVENNLELNKIWQNNHYNYYHNYCYSYFYFDYN